MECEAKSWVRWEEEMVPNDRGRREVRYYVLDDCGGRDLAVIGSEKSARHMTYAVPEKFFQSLIRISATASPSSVADAADAVPSDRKLRSRRQVVDWLSLLVSDSMPYGLPPMVDRYSDDEDASTAYVPTSKFSWLGSARDCRKRRKHYQSFHRNGITISVNDFVFVLMENNKRLVAYIEDLYEDMMSRNIVAARWFHKVDEVSIVLPPDTNDREIFFSLCLQDFSVECIDGLAAVLGSEDFEKFQKEALQKHSPWEPYLCRRLIDNDNVKPFDITRLQGYWSQNLLRSMYPSYLKLRLKRTADGNQNVSVSQGNGKRKPLSSSGLLGEIRNSKFSNVGNRLERNRLVSDSFMKGLVKKNAVPLHQDSIGPGANVELFSQDSGMRGCWFSCVVLKRRHDKIKVQYLDVQDADEIGNLEEWVSTSRTAAPDKLGIRVLGRPIVRPCPSKKDVSSNSHEVGEAVDAWWHDGWWEGIVISSDGEEKIRVYFPAITIVIVYLGDRYSVSPFRWVKGLILDCVTARPWQSASRFFRLRVAGLFIEDRVAARLKACLRSSLAVHPVTAARSPVPRAAGDSSACPLGQDPEPINRHEQHSLGIANRILKLAVCGSGLESFAERVTVRSDVFLGEQRVSIFSPSDLRSSQDWVENKWNRMKKRRDIASLLLSELDGEKCSEEKSSDCITFQSPSSAPAEPEPIRGKENRLPRLYLAKEWRPQLAKDFHDGLRWSSTRKRTHGRQLFGKEFTRSKRARFGVGQKCGRNNSGAFLMPKSLNPVDEENCKIGGEPLFGTPMAALCSNLVMTR
ncbi:hypothetical protein KSP39_PZI005227 [Platanthera zijinensis]|uniref:BAH domain-containing protein n=1 Tax=Platanthera zijinensis TaxID=2320716 RepID=A0AAP0GBV2_9ASPA